MSITDLMTRSLESSNYGVRRDRPAFPLQVLNSPKNLGKSTNRFYVGRGIASSTQFQKEKQSLETQILSSQKTNSVGQLAGGIVHDFNNLLVAILGLTDLALYSSTNEELSDRLGEIKETGKLGKDMIQGLLNFSRHQGGCYSP
jgi:signal transduction histidine kinase